MTRRLLEAVRAGDTASRLGGDEFVVVLNGVADSSEVTHIVEQRLIPLIRQSHHVDGAELRVSCSVGIAVFPDDATDLDELMHQPRIDAASGSLVAVEGLLRWQSPELNTVRSAIARHGVAPGRLELELTESMVMEDAERHLQQMHALRALGVGLSIDDFGTGYSSLAYLNRFPIDKLKIDRSFVHDMLGDSTDRAITMAIIGLGHTLGLKVVAEGVEQEGEAAPLREARCDELQGFLFARAMPATALALWAERRERVPA